MSGSNCSHCHAKITKVQRKGVKCIKCPTWIHVACAALPVGHEIWTCDKCKRRSSGTSRRVSVTGQKASSSTLVHAPQPVSTTPNISNTQLSAEIADLKRLVVVLTERVIAMDERQQAEINSIRRHYRDISEELNNLKKSTNDVNVITTDNKLETLPNFPIICSETAPAKSSSSRTEMAQRSATTDSECLLSDLPKASQLSHRSELCRIDSDCGISSFHSMNSNKWISVSNLAPETNSEEILNFISSKLKVEDGSVFCSKITPRSLINPTFVAFKIGIPNSIFEYVISRKFWPDDVIVKEFHNKSNFRRTAKINGKS